MLMHIKVIVEEDAICIAMELLIPVIVTIIFIKGEFLLFFLYISVQNQHNQQLMISFTPLIISVFK